MIIIRDGKEIKLTEAELKEAAKAYSELEKIQREKQNAAEKELRRLWHEFKIASKAKTQPYPRNLLLMEYFDLYPACGVLYVAASETVQESVNNRLLAEIDKLPDKQRTALELCYKDSKSLKAAGAIMGISAKSVNDIRHKAIRELRLASVYKYILGDLITHELTYDEITAALNSVFFRLSPQ